jgi:Ca2+-dependent lipid-binding protein
MDLKTIGKVIMIFATVSLNASTIKITISNTKSNGLAWDVFNGAPDPYIIVDGESYRAERCRNSFSCTFYTGNTITGPVTIEVWDADEMKDDPAGSTFCAPGEICSTSNARIIIYK